MYLGKVIGTLVATVKDESLIGLKLLIVQPLDEREQPDGRPLVAADAIRTSGVGDLVYLVSKKEAAFPFPADLTSVDASIVGFVDSHYVPDRDPSTGS